MSLSSSRDPISSASVLIGVLRNEHDRLAPRRRPVAAVPSVPVQKGKKRRGLEVSPERIPQELDAWRYGRPLATISGQMYPLQATSSQGRYRSDVSQHAHLDWPPQTDARTTVETGRKARTGGPSVVKAPSKTSQPLAFQPASHPGGNFGPTSHEAWKHLASSPASHLQQSLTTGSRVDTLEERPPNCWEMADWLKAESELWSNLQSVSFMERLWSRFHPFQPSQRLPNPLQWQACRTVVLPRIS
jgi:hypothetical protein